jgi:uncharacterized protein YkwD
LLLALALAVVAFPATAAAAAPNQVEQSFLQAVNEARTSHGLQGLAMDATLLRVARAHSQDMVRRHYFAHGDYVRRLFGVGAGPTVGEALAWGTGAEADPHFLVRRWLNSPEHRINLLRAGYRRVGIGVAFGPFMGWRKAVVVTADFEGR